MARNLELAVLLRLNDQMSSGVRAALQGMSREATLATRSVESIATAANRVRPTGIERMNAALRTMHGTARSALSVLTQVGRVTAQVGAGAVAGGYVLKSAAERPMAYDRRLALLSNTANSDLDAAGRIAAKEKLNAGIRNAVNAGGGTPELAADALNTLVGSGAFGNANQAVSLLPTLQKYATGTGASSQDLSRILIAAKQTMGITGKDMPAMLSKAIRAGQEGGFELTDMATWLPQQMTLAGANGMKGMAGFESLLAANQVSRITAGTSDEAGNNLVNLLAKINSQDTAKDFKKQGINLPARLAAARGNGTNPLETFVALVDKIASKDKGYTRLRKKADSETGADKQATLSAMADIMQQKGIGKTIQDRQALMGLLAMIQQRDKYNAVKGAVGVETGKEGDTSYATVASTLDFKAEQLANKKAFAATDTLVAINEPLARLLDKTNELAEANPNLTAAAYSATTALTALAAAAGAAGLVGMVTGRTAATTGAAAVGGGLLSRAAFGIAGSARSLSLLSALPAAMVPGSATAAMGMVSMGIGAGAGYGLNRLAQGTPAEAAIDLIAKPIADVLEKFMNQPVRVEIGVRNGNITAEVNKANSQQARRN